MTASERAVDVSAGFWREPGFWRRTGASALGLWVSVSLGFLTTVVVARTLGPAGFGAVALATAMVATLTALLDVPLEEPAVHFGWRALVGGAPGSAHRLLTRSLAADLAVGVVVAALLVIGAAPAAQAVSRGWLDPTLVRLAALVALVQTADGTTGAALLVAGRPDVRAWAMAVASALRLSVVGGAAVAFGTPRWVLVASLVAGVLGSGVQAWLAWRLGWSQWRKGERRPEAEVGMAQLLSFGLRSAVATTISGARSGLIPTILGRLAGAEAVGFFEVATFPMQVAGVAGAPVRLALFPEQARLWAERNRDELRRSVRLYVRVGLLIGIPAAAVGWLLLPWLIGALYSPGYAAAAEPARILLLAAVLGLAFGWSKTLPAAVGRPGIRVAVLGLDALTVIPLLVLLASRGAQGAAIAITAGLLVQALAWVLLLPRVVPAGPEELLPVVHNNSEEQR